MSLFFLFFLLLAGPAWAATYDNPVGQTIFQLYGTSASDIITNEGIITTNLRGNGTDGFGGSDTITNSGSIGGSIYGSVNGDNSSGGSNTIANSGTVWNIIGSFNLGDNSSGGSNTFTNSGTLGLAIFGSYNTGANTSGGSNTITNSGTTGNIIGNWNFGANSSGGSNTIANTGSTGTIYGSYNIGSGSSGGSNTIANSGSTSPIYGSVNFGANSSGGSNTIANSGTVVMGIVGSLNSGTNSRGGSNTITNSGLVNGDIFGSLNSGIGSMATGNTISNSGTVNGSIWGSRNDGAGSVGGNDTITNSGTITGSIFGADGNDTIILVGGSTLGGVADGGTGNNNLGFDNMGTVDGSLLGTKYLNFQNLGIYGGSTTLTGAWNFSGGTTIYLGTLSLDGAISTGALDILSGGTMDVNGTATVNGATTVAGLLNIDSGGVFTGNSLDILSGGTMDVNGTATVNGATTVAGLLNINSSGVFTGNSLDILSGGTMDVNGTATVNGATTVAGLLNINSSGVFTGNSLDILSGGTAEIRGTADIQGPTNDYGTLLIDGSLLTSLLTVERSGLLAGNGSIFGDVVVYGTVSPGHSIGTLDIDGSVRFMPGSTYVAELANNGNCDQLRVNGPVSIHGANLNIFLEQALYPNGRSWRIIDAGRVNGSFSSIDTNFTSYTISLQQEIRGGSLDLVVVRTPYADFGSTANQTAVGSGLDQLLPSAHGNMANLLINMDFAMNPSQIAATLKGLNPEMYTSFPTSGLEIAGTFERIVALRQQKSETDPTLSTVNRGNLWNVWGQALGDWFDRDTQEGISGFTLTTEGAAFGMDREFGSLIRAGLVLGYSNSDLSWNEDPDNSGEIGGKHIGVYGSTQYSGFYLDGIAGYTSLDNSAGRTIATPVFTGKVASSFGSSVWEGNLSGGYDFTFGELRIGPAVSIDYQHLNQDGFSDNGTQDFDVQVHSDTAESLTSSLGLRLTGVFKGGDWRFLPRAGLFWLHQFKDDAVRLTTNFVDYPAATFTVTGADPAANQAMGNLGLSAEYNKNLSFYLDFSTALADKQISKLLAGGLTWKF